MSTLPFEVAPHVVSHTTHGVALPLAAADSTAITIPYELLAAVERRRREYVAGRLCAARALWMLGLGGLSVGRNHSGAPCWPEGIMGSITHTDTMAYAVVSATRTDLRIGIDSEPLLSRAAQSDVLSACCNRDERTYLVNAPDPRLAATVAFSAKESFFKAVSDFVGRFIDFDEAVVYSIDWQHRVVEIAPDPQLFVPRCFALFTVESQCVHTSVSISLT
ncbi:MAG: 4'-phosphopantetheinyl transferase superfamily protein [Alphaproteobacteria bacterium]|nr:4'-phosphopantetheinyl transferase superfamily protein [Alphaproteobacteria bacterium]